MATCDTYDHIHWKTRDPVRSPKDKLASGGAEAVAKAGAKCRTVRTLLSSLPRPLKGSRGPQATRFKRVLWGSVNNLGKLRKLDYDALKLCGLSYTTEGIVKLSGAEFEILQKCAEEFIRHYKLSTLLYRPDVDKAVDSKLEDPEDGELFNKFMQGITHCPTTIDAQTKNEAITSPNEEAQAYQDDEPSASLPKRPRTFDTASNSGIYPNHDAHSSLVHGDYTIAWICALPLELAASRAMLDEEHPLPPNQAGDDNIYVLGRIDQHNVVMTCLPGQYGTNNAAIVATHLKRSFPSVRATLMVGIGGGSPSQADLYLGDVVVGTRIMQYDMGKMIAGGLFQETADAKTPAWLLNSAVSALRSKHGPRCSSSRMTSLLRSRLPNILRPSCPDHLFQASYEHHPLEAPTCIGCDLEKLQPRGARLSDEPKIHYGVIASGNRVVKDGKARDDIAQRLSALCFEMEAAGMMDNLQCLPIRGICDYSDSHKNKEWQDFAAATAAAYARELLEGLPPSSRTLDRALTYITDASQPDTAEPRFGLHIPEPAVGFHSTLHTGIGLILGSNRRIMASYGYKARQEPEIFKKPSMAVASFFFNARGDYLERSISGMYRSLLLQLLYGFPDLQSVLDDTDIVPRNQQDCPDLIALKELLRSAIMSLGRRCFTCFVDALDECDEQEVRDMVHFFEELAENANDNGIRFRICFSSRPYPYIDIHRGLLLTLEEQSGHREDLAQYVKSHLRITHRPLLEELQSQILDKAAGIFMWVVLVVEILNKESSHGALALRKKLSEIPAELSELFRRMLIRDNDRPESLQLCILWILFAKRPLSPAEFRHAMWAGLLEQRLADPELPDDTHMDAVKLVTSSSKGLAEITKSEQPTVQFIHESVRDFLVKENGIQDLWPGLGFDWEGPSHDVLKRCCTTYLHHPKVQAIILAPEGGDEERNAMAEKCSFLGYAGQQVLYHANAAAPAVPQDGFLTQFFASAGIRMINHLEKFIVRRYRSRATPLYVLADRGLGNLIRTQMKREPATYVPGERYQYPLFAALANGHKSAIAALLGVSSTVCDGIDITEGLNYRRDLKNYQGRTPLSWAAEEGRLSILELLIQGGANINVIDEWGGAPLVRALQNRHEAVARLLIDKGADVNARDSDGSTALIYALRNDYEAVAQLLIDKGADVNARGNDGSTALISASINGYEAVARLLIDKGADVNARDSNGSTALIWALRTGHEAVARLLIDKGADVNARDSDGSTALIYALRNDYEAVAQLLINKGADVNARGNNGSTALISASRTGREAAMRLLIDKGADVNARDSNGSTALIWALRTGHEAVARLLIDKGADVNARDSDGSTALIYALRNDYEAVAQLLIDKGADVNARDSDGSTALIYALRNDYEAVAQLLIDKGADVNARGYNGWTALIWASRNGHEAVARLLIDKGVDVNARDSNGWTVLISASKNGYEAVARLLIDKGVDVNARDSDGSTALICASRNGHEAVVRLLIDKGADINARESDGWTALIWALWTGHEAVARLLIDKGADVNARGNNGSTALISASRTGHEAVARLLIDKGADVNARDSDGSTALIYALRNDYEAVAQLLIDNGALGVTISLT
ncbi:ankyrin repeat-containing domain protein [Lasiosphaeria ovina]|uniref:Ankyrin repeat-containing domain protein n=1 Tax=Lasiosphaeria ovina TaxID=92902 RepID=A0AAE0JU33_9PEZI|nr:ankyrin repeat-containing domain protein [Lasiosphaeria ovina]